MKPTHHEEFSVTCGACGEENPEEFPVCWSCQADLPEPARRSAATRPRATSRTSSALASATWERPRQPADTPRRESWLQVGIALAVLWLPNAYAATEARFFPPGQPAGAWDELYRLIVEGGQIALLLYWLRGSGRWAAKAALGRPRIATELVWAVLLFASWWLIGQGLGLMRPSFLSPSIDDTHLWFVPDDALGWVFVAAVLVVSAAVEELLFRAYLWTRLTQLTDRPMLAAGLSSLLFVVVHPYGAWDSLTLFVWSMAFHLVFWVEGKLWRLILAHALFNLLLTVGAAGHVV